MTGFDLRITFKENIYDRKSNQFLETMFSLSTEIFKHPRQATQQSTQQTTKPNLNKIPFK